MKKYYLSLVRRKVQRYIDAAKKAMGQYESFAHGGPKL
jgi:hypothetical protein